MEGQQKGTVGTTPRGTHRPRSGGGAGRRGGRGPARARAGVGPRPGSGRGARRAFVDRLAALDLGSPRATADRLQQLLGSGELATLRASDGTSARAVAVERLLALGYPYALEVAPEDLAHWRQERPSGASDGRGLAVLVMTVAVCLSLWGLSEPPTGVGLGVRAGPGRRGRGRGGAAVAPGLGAPGGVRPGRPRLRPGPPLRRRDAAAGHRRAGHGALDLAQGCQGARLGDRRRRY